MTSDAATAAVSDFDWKKYLFMGIGIFLFVLVYYSPPWPAAIDPTGKAFFLSPAGKGAIAVFLLASTWWVFEVVPIGVTSLAIGVLQVLFMIRPAQQAFKDFMDPSVLFIFGSIEFDQSGVNRRLFDRIQSS